MTWNSCSHEIEVAELLRNGHWPLASAPELRAHVSTCSRCSDLVLITQAFRQSRIESERSARLNSPGVVWWRAQLRQRNAALERIARPIQGAQIFALIVSVSVAVGLVVSQARHGLGWLSWWSGLEQTQAFHLETLWSFAQITSGWSLAVVIAGGGALALLSGVVLYLAFDRK
jgi:hypothetical protein